MAASGKLLVQRVEFEFVDDKFGRVPNRSVLVNPIADNRPFMIGRGNVGTGILPG